jgi:hypothetical protein
MKNYILRIYRYKKNNPGSIVGVVEEPQRKGKTAFTNLNELWEILNPKHLTDSQKTNHSSKLSVENRKHTRKDAAYFTEYSMDAVSGELTSSGVITDMSRSGLCLLTPEAINKGENIFIKCHTSTPPRCATVRWSKKYKDCHFRAGLEFVN